MISLELQQRLIEARFPIAITLVEAHGDEAVRTRALQTGPIVSPQKRYREQGLLNAVPGAQGDQPERVCPESTEAQRIGLTCRTRAIAAQDSLLEKFLQTRMACSTLNAAIQSQAFREGRTKSGGSWQIEDGWSAEG